MTASTGLRAVRLEHSGAVPLAGQQGELDVETVVLDRAAPPGDRPADPVFHGVEVQVNLFGSLFVARPAAKEDPVRLSHAGRSFLVPHQNTMLDIHSDPFPPVARPKRYVCSTIEYRNSDLHS